MTKIYSRRERVAAALNHQEPDRVPCDLTISPPAYQKLCDHLGLKYEPYWWDDENHAFPSVDVLEKLDIDICHFPTHCFVPDDFDMYADEFTDKWGVHQKKVWDSPDSFMYIRDSTPLEGVECAADVLNYSWPTADDLFDADKAVETVRPLYEETDFALTCVFGGHLFELPHMLMGMEDYLCFLYTDPDIVETCISKILEINMELEKKVFAAIGKYLTHIRLNGEDVGTQRAPMISPELYRRMIKPWHKKEWNFVKEEFHKYNPEGKLMIHTCGAVYDFIPDFIDAGCDILNPLQPNASGMDTALIGKNFGDRLSFHGAIDSQGVLGSGSKEEIREEVRKRICDLAPGGGFLAAPSHNVQSNVDPANVVTMYEAIHEYGVYPIRDEL